METKEIICWVAFYIINVGVGWFFTKMESIGDRIVYIATAFSLITILNIIINISFK
jgi:hypothetical protein